MSTKTRVNLTVDPYVWEQFRAQLSEHQSASKEVERFMKNYLDFHTGEDQDEVSEQIESVKEKISEVQEKEENVQEKKAVLQAKLKNLVAQQQQQEAKWKAPGEVIGDAE